MFTPPFPRAEADGSDSGEAQLEDSKIRLGDVDPSRRGIIDTIIRETKANISAHIKLVTMDPAAYADGEAGFVREFMAQACAKEKGPADSVTPQVAILFDVKNSGEASHRPALRMPPLTDQRYGPKIKMVMERFGAPEPDPATGQAVPTISSSDVFLVMNGGKDGNQAEFMKPFAGAKKYVKNITLFREEESAMNRLGKVQGYATLNCLENLLVVQAEKSRVKKATYEHFPTCSTLSNMVGPIVMPPFDQVWRLPWKIKKELYGKALILVGGQVQDADDIEEPEERKVKRTPEAVEPVFYHGYPPIVFQDILKSLQVRYCIDLTPGDGAAALACYKLGIVYLGFTFTQVHTEQLAARLEHEILQAMANEADPLYSARLVGALAAAPEPTGTATPKPAPGPRRGRKRNKPEPPSAGEDPEPMDDGGDPDPDPDEASEPELNV